VWSHEMKAKLAIALSFGVSLVQVPRAFAEHPPVDVRVLDDEDEDFFNDGPSKKEKAKAKAEEERSEDKSDGEAKASKKKSKSSDEYDPYEESDARAKGEKIKRTKRSGENEKTNQQVGTVAVVGEKDTQSIARTKASAENDASNEAKQLQ